MGNSTKSQRLLRAAREGQPVQRVEIPRVACTRCGQDGIYALSDGSLRPHLRPAVQSDPAYREDIPTRVECN